MQEREIELIPTVIFWGFFGTIVGSIVGVILGRKSLLAMAGGLIGLMIGLIDGAELDR